jgi:multisubunit Na+/H+ antiporter MnhC subunit
MEIGDERCDTMWNPVVHSLLLTALYIGLST